MKNLESAYKKLPVKMNAFFINEYVHVKYIKIKEGLNCFLSLRKLTYEHPDLFRERFVEVCLYQSVHFAAIRVLHILHDSGVL